MARLSSAPRFTLIATTATSCRVLLRQGHDPVFVVVRHRAAIAGEDDDHDFLILQIGQGMLLAVGAGQIAPGRRRVADIQDAIEFAGNAQVAAKPMTIPTNKRSIGDSSRDRKRLKR